MNNEEDKSIEDDKPYGIIKVDGLDTSVEHITIYGIGSFPCNNDITEFYTWGVDIRDIKSNEDNSLDTMLEDTKAQQFRKEISKHITDNYKDFVSVNKSSKETTIALPLISFRDNIDTVCQILQKYFPEIKYQKN
jgi:hypothetical protein